MSIKCTAYIRDPFKNNKVKIMKESLYKSYYNQTKQCERGISASSQ